MPVAKGVIAGDSLLRPVKELLYSPNYKTIFLPGATVSSLTEHLFSAARFSPKLWDNVRFLWLLVGTNDVDNGLYKDDYFDVNKCHQWKIHSQVWSIPIFLGMGVHGGQKPYYDIMDFLPKRSPYDTSPDGNTVIVQQGDGSLFVEPQMTKEKQLEKVSWQQWNEANLLIMQKLMQEGTPAGEYMTYSIIIFQLSQKYDWVSVLKFDREYRKKQANSGRPWGSDMPFLRDIILIPKGQVFKQTQGKQFENSGKNSKSGNRQGGKNHSGGKQSKEKRFQRPEYSDKLKICHLFNEGYCSFGDRCKFKHLCADCGDKNHNALSHSN